MYANIPEVLPDVHFVMIPKRQNVLSRLIQMLRTIRSHKQTTDVYILCNGPSTELPFWLSQLFSSHPFIFIYNDAAALARTHHSWWRNYIHASLCARAKAVVDIGATIAEYCPPEIHPLLPYPETAQSKFETLWEKHLTEITDHLYVT